MPSALQQHRRALTLGGLLLATAALAFAALSIGNDPGAGPAAAARSTPQQLTAAERDALRYLREEEKLARDVYVTLASTSGDRRFTNISRSEQRHMDAVGALLTRYGIKDPAAGNDPGEFTDPELQQAYDQLISHGTTSRDAALEVGRTIETMDLADLAERRELTRRADILAVIDNLAAGSQRHLAAFSR